MKLAALSALKLSTLWVLKLECNAWIGVDVEVGATVGAEVGDSVGGMSISGLHSVEVCGTFIASVLHTSNDVSSHPALRVMAIKVASAVPQNMPLARSSPA